MQEGEGVVGGGHGAMIREVGGRSSPVAMWFVLLSLQIRRNTDIHRDAKRAIISFPAEVSPPRPGNVVMRRPNDESFRSEIGSSAF